jgi:hypothetical protein
MPASDSCGHQAAKAKKNPTRPRDQSQGLRYNWFEIVGSIYPMRKRGYSRPHLIRGHGPLPHLCKHSLPLPRVYCPAP